MAVIQIAILQKRCSAVIWWTVCAVSIFLRVQTQTVQWSANGYMEYQEGNTQSPNSSNAAITF
jgi:hypothetical protein